VKYAFKYFVLNVFALFFLGCYSESIIVKLKPNQKVTKIILSDGRVVNLSDDELGYGLVKDDAVVRFLNDGSIEEIPISKINTAYFREDLYSDSTSMIPLILTGLLLSVVFITIYFI